MLQVAVLMACHNRRAKTVASLQALRRAAGFVPGLTIQVFLTDDGSTDGTADAVRALAMPVTVVDGTGDLYWNRGMVRAWQTALDAGVAFNGFLLLNDDTLLDDHALASIVAADRSRGGEAVIVGAVRDPVSAEVTYGGVRRTSAWHPGKTAVAGVSETVQAVDTFNANCVLVPWRVYECVGTLDPVFTHAMGDFDYGLRARRAALEVVVAPGTVGTCPRNDSLGTWRDPDIPVLRRLRLLESPKGLPRREWREYLRRHGAPAPRLMAWLPTLRVLATSLCRGPAAATRSWGGR